MNIEQMNREMNIEQGMGTSNKEQGIMNDSIFLVWIFQAPLSPEGGNLDLPLERMRRTDFRVTKIFKFQPATINAVVQSFPFGR